MQPSRPELTCNSCGSGIKPENRKCQGCGTPFVFDGKNVIDFINDGTANTISEEAYAARRKGAAVDELPNLILKLSSRIIGNASGRFLDAGCGNAWFSIELAKRNPGIFFTGVDIINSFDAKDAPGNYLFVRSDIFKAPFIKNSFDGLVSFDVIEHIEDDAGFLGRLFSFLKPGGVFVIGTPNLNRLGAVLSDIMKGKRKFPVDYGADPVLGETVHIREYSENDIRVLFSKFADINFRVKPVFLGLRLGKKAIGFREPILGRYFCYYWLVYGQKLSS